jgi:hypothetical protein
VASLDLASHLTKRWSEPLTGAKILLSMISTLKSLEQRALVSGRSAYSR